MGRTHSEDTASLPLTLKRARRAAGFSNAKDFLAAVKASGRQAPSYSTYAQWESGEVAPRDTTLEPIVDYHRERETWPDDQPTPDLAAAILALTDELRAAREERAEVAQRLDQIDALLKRLGAPSMPELAGPLAPEPTAGSK